jgi:hypothetical protein
MTTEYFLPIFISWLLIAAIVGASIVVVAYEEKEDERKRRARKMARKNAQERARLEKEIEEARASRDTAFAHYEARRDFYRDIKTRRVIFDSVKTDPEGNLIWAKGRVA